MKITSEQYLQALRSNAAKEAEYRKLYRARPQDSVRVYQLPKGSTNNAGSYTFQTKTVKVQDLELKSIRLQKKINRLQSTGGSSREKSRKLHLLRNNLRYVESLLAQEMARLPRNVMVIEEME